MSRSDQQSADTLSAVIAKLKNAEAELLMAKSFLHQAGTDPEAWIDGALASLRSGLSGLASAEPRPDDQQRAEALEQIERWRTSWSHTLPIGMDALLVTIEACLRAPAAPQPKMAEALERYIEEHGAMHVDDCPEDDTCFCSYAWINDGINAATKYLRAPASPAARPDLTQWTLDNIYTLARREANRSGSDLKAWNHVLRLCEKAGCQGRGVLRDNGGSVGVAVPTDPAEGKVNER